MSNVLDHCCLDLYCLLMNLLEGIFRAGNLGYEVCSIVVRPRTVMTKLWNLLTESLFPVVVLDSVVVTE